MSNSYSFSWAAGVYRDFLKDYARATSILSKLYEFDESLPIRYLSEDQIKWERFKKQVKRVDKFMNYAYEGDWPEFEEIPKQMLRDLKDELKQRYLFAQNAT